MNVLALCAGIGGLEIGINLAEPRSRTVCYVEGEGYAAAILVARMAEKALHEAPIWSDVRTFNGTTWRGKVDCITGGYPCFAGGTLVLTENGYCPIENIEVGDLVLTHRGRWMPVTSTISKNNARTRKIFAQGVPGIECTDEHPFLCHVSRLGEEEWVCAKELIESRTYLSQTIPNEEIQDDHSVDFWWVVGRYLACGWLVERKSRSLGARKTKRPSGRTVICSNSEKASELEKRLQLAGLTWWVEKTRTVDKYHITKTFLYRFLKPFGHLAHEKTVPGWVFQLSQAKSKALLEGYLSGDGYEEKSSFRANSVSKSLALSIALICQKALGVVASVRFQKKNPKYVIEGRTVKQRSYWTVDIPKSNRSAYIDDDGYGRKLVRRNEVYGEGTVYNIAVKSDESYLADGAIVHNCQPFSLAGKRKGENDPRHLWPHIKRIVSEIKPAQCFFENVAGHLSLGFETVANDLQGMGYKVAAGLFTAEEIGAPHKRERLFIFAMGDTQPSRLQGKSVEEVFTTKESAERRGEMGDSNSTRLPGGKNGKTNRESERERWLQESKRGVGVLEHSFPPGRDSKQWNDIIRLFPKLMPAISYELLAEILLESQTEIEPQFRRMVDGVASRLDRIRACGNGVVPLQAAYAYITLRNSFTERSDV